MKLENRRDPASEQSEKLPMRDLFLLPAIGLLTACALTGSAFLLADLSLPRLHTLREDCMVFNDRSTGPRAIPNSVCRENNPESQPVEYRFNRCGHRAGMECDSKPRGTYRIVLVGSSVAFGAWVPREKTFAAILPAELSQQTGRTIDVYNEGMIWKTPRNLPLSFNQIMAVHPDMILWAIGPWELEHVSETGPSEATPSGPPQPVPGSSHPTLATEPGFLGHTRYRVKQALAEKTFAATASELIDVGRSLLLSQYNAKVGPAMDRAISRVIASIPHDEKIKVLLQNFLYESQSQYLKATLMDRQENEFLLENPGPAWQSRMDEFDIYVAEMEAKSRAAGIPLVVVLVPTRAQAAMISIGEWPGGYDPYRVGADVQKIVARHGGIYVDILPELRSVPNPENGYFPSTAI